MRGATIWRYALPMDAGVVLRDRRLKQREGFVVRLRDGEREGWGEIAPLPGFSAESPDDARHAASVWLAAWCRGESPAESPLPSVAFGLSCAAAELAGTLPQAGNYQTAALCTGDPDELFLRLAKRTPCVAKIKVGLFEAARDGMTASLLLEAIPDLRLRLDANRSWSLARALQFAGYIDPALRHRIAFLEEPCQSREASRQFAAETGIAIAWDESSREAGFQLAAEPGVSAVIIKPTLTGSIATVERRVADARRLGLTAVISSSLESSLGLTQLARLAQWLTPDVIPGLDTLNLMQQQLLRAWPGSPLPVTALQEDACLWQR